MKNYIHYAIYGIIIVVSCSQSSLTPEKISENIFGTYEGVQNGYIYGFMNNDIIQDEPQIWEITQGKLDTIFVEYKGPNIPTASYKFKAILKGNSFYVFKQNACVPTGVCYQQAYGCFYENTLLLYNFNKENWQVTKYRQTFLGTKQ